MVREICDRYGVLLIFDEVITGFGRLGEWFGAQVVEHATGHHLVCEGDHERLLPAGRLHRGTELSATCSRAVPRRLGATCTPTPHIPAAWLRGLKNLEIIKRENLIQNARERGVQLADRLAEIKERHEMVGDARGIGLVQGLELVADRETKRSFAPEVGIGGRLTDALKRRGVWVRVGAYILPVSPPLTITAQELDELCDAIEDAMVEVSAGL